LRESERYITVESVTEEGSASDSTSHSIPYPEINEGDLLFLFAGCDGTGDTITLPGLFGTNELENGGHGGGGYAVSYIISDGTESGNISITISSTETLDVFWVRILAKDWHGVTPPESVVGTGSSTDAPDCGALAPSWGKSSALWLCWTAKDHSDVGIDAYPLPANNNRNEINESLHVCTDVIEAETFDPPAWAFDATFAMIAGMVAVRPTLEKDITLGPTIIRQTRTKQPAVGTKIDFSNPLAKGLVFATYFEHAETASVRLKNTVSVPVTNTGTPTVSGYEQSGSEILRYQAPCWIK